MRMLRLRTCRAYCPPRCPHLHSSYRPCSTWDILKPAFAASRSFLVQVRTNPFGEFQSVSLPRSFELDFLKGHAESVHEGLHSDRGQCVQTISIPALPKRLGDHHRFFLEFCRRESVDPVDYYPLPIRPNGVHRGAVELAMMHEGCSGRSGASESGFHRILPVWERRPVKLRRIPNEEGFVGSPVLIGARNPPAALMAKCLSQLSLRYSYRFLWIPGTIGSVTWLSHNEARVSRIEHGLVIAGIADPGQSTYKKSGRGDAEIDRAVAHVLTRSGDDFEIMDFFPYGYDERQFCSPGSNLPVGCFMRTPYSRYPESHTSADNLNFVQPQYLADSFAKCLSVMTISEDNGAYLNQNPKGQPQLGKRGLYREIGGWKDEKGTELAMLCALNYSDGSHTLLDIADRSDLEFRVIRDAAEVFLEHGLLKESAG